MKIKKKGAKTPKKVEKPIVPPKPKKPAGPVGRPRRWPGEDSVMVYIPERFREDVIKLIHKLLKEKKND